MRKNSVRDFNLNLDQWLWGKCCLKVFFSSIFNFAGNLPVQVKV